MVKNKRFWEIDFLRGIAIVMMVIFHFIYDLSFFGYFSFNVFSGFWFYFGKFIAILFLLLVGVSLIISLSFKKKNYSYYFRRGLKILFYGLIISVVTWFYIGETYIRFGILHLIGLSVIIAYPFLELKKWINVFLAFCFLFFGILLNKFYFGFNFLLFLGFKGVDFSSVDYYPVFPWFGVILFGIVLGNHLYSCGKRRFKIVDLSSWIIVKWFCYLGRNSLLIYFVHQPVILLVLKFFRII